MMTILLLSLMAGAAAVFLYAKLRPAKAASVGTSSRIEPSWQIAEDEVKQAIALWPILRSDPLFYICIFSGCIVIGLSILGAKAISFGIPVMWAILGALALTINAAQFAETVFRDRGTDDFLSFSTQDRSRGSWIFLAFLVVINATFSAAGSMSMADKLKTSGEVIVSSFESKQAAIARLEEERDVLRTSRLNQAGDLSVEAMQRKASQAKELREIEEKTGKGPRYKGYLDEETKWRNLADNAVKEQAIGEKIAALREKVEAVGESGEARSDPAPHATALQTAFGIPAERTAYLIPIILGIAATIIDQVLLFNLGDRIGARRAARWRWAAERANDALVNAGMAPRYMIPASGIGEDIKALQGPQLGGDTININLSEDVRAQIEGSSNLKEIDALFNAVFVNHEGGKVPIGKAYQIFSTMKAGTKHMNPTDFRAAVLRYCELMKIDVLSNQIVGFKVGVSQHAEAAE